MAEIALRTKERKSDRGQHHFWRPVGSTIVCLSDSLIRRKQLEIYCDLASPKKRHDPAFQNIPGFDRICEAWTPELWEAWFEHDRPQSIDPNDLPDVELSEKILTALESTDKKRLSDPVVRKILKLNMTYGGINTPGDFRSAWDEDGRPFIGYELGQLLMDNDYPQEVWINMIEPIGVLADIPFAPESDVKAHDTWLWSSYERKNYFIVVNADAEDEEVEGWQSVETRDADLGIVLPELERDPVEISQVVLEQAPRSVINGVTVFFINDRYNIARLLKQNGGDLKIYIFETYDPHINIAHIWKKQFDYIADPEISGQTMDDIANPDKVLHPRFDKPIEAARMKQPKIADFKRN